MQFWFSNPEFQRQLWLQLTRHRLIAAPLILLLVFCARLDEGGFLVSLNLMSKVALTIFVIATILWGAGLAYASLADEIRQNTWDWQRVSAIQPWAMIWGKIIGSAAFAWYIGIPCLVVIALSADSKISWFQPINSFYTIVLLVVSALAAQGFGLLSALVAHKSGMLLKRTSGFLFIFILLSLSLFQIKPSVDNIVGWFGLSFSGQEFILLSVSLFAGWIWLGCYRLMQDALMIKTIPWAAAVFIVFLSVYLTGKQEPIAFELTHVNTIARYGMLIGGVMTYIGAWLERINLVTIKRIYLAFSKNKIDKALQETPYFVVTALVTLCCLVWIVLYYTPVDSYKQGFGIYGSENLKVQATALFLLMLRDIGILTYCSMNAKTERAGFTAIFYILLLDFILPIFTPRPIVGFILPVFAGDLSGWFGPVVAAFHLVVIVLLIVTRFSNSRS